MTKEQEEAIEIFDGLKRNKEIIKDIDKDYFFTFAETIINLIQEQHGEIEKKDKQIEQYQNMLATNDILHVLKCEKKDKMIDLMAIAIGNEPLQTEEYCIFRNFDCPAVGGNRDCKECVKQYYERRVENGN